jgi:LPPG:FO 2-phospho-L-lactate transferase
MSRHVLALAGGVGGAKLALGLALLLPPSDLTIAVNTGDDDEFHGLYVSPDLDTVVYSLAGVVNPATGWGRAGDTRVVLAELERLGAQAWFGLGDRDLAMHIRRSELLRAGVSLSAVTAELGARLGVEHRVVPMSDDRVRTLVTTDQGEMTFQEYFVLNRAEPRVLSLTFSAADRASPSPGFAAALASAAAVVFCPSNPFLSIAPILALPGVREALLSPPSRPRVVVSPIIAGEAVKGPTALLFGYLAGEEPSCLAVARHYRGLASHFVLDELDAQREPEVAALGYRTLVAQTLMQSAADKLALARAVCDWLEGEAA